MRLTICFWYLLDIKASMIFFLDNSDSKIVLVLTIIIKFFLSLRRKKFVSFLFVSYEMVNILSLMNSSSAFCIKKYFASHSIPDPTRVFFIGSRFRLNRWIYRPIPRHRSVLMLIGKLRRAFAAIFPLFLPHFRPFDVPLFTVSSIPWPHCSSFRGIDTPLHKIRRRILVACIGRLQFTSL